MGRLLINAFATFFGTGLAPFAPATVASLGVAVLWGLASPVPVAAQVGLLALVVALGVPAAGWMERRHGKDPHRVVCDEVAGMLVTYFGLTTGWAGWLAGFAWFRVFDIAKPFPIRRLEALPGGWGIMADDLLAGVYAHLLLRATLAVTGW
ncbi:MAG: phosphatidylglycerophosphatase A [Gemmatimonas sp.]|nr:phosphatidylglycerophosphatase A [Gemmatimonas sp.]